MNLLTQVVNWPWAKDDNSLNLSKPPDMDEWVELRWWLLRLLTLVGFALCLRVERRVWTGPRLCPKAPLWKALSWNTPDLKIYQLIFLGLALSALGNPAALALTLGLVAFMCSLDFTRFRPWVYQFSFILLGFCCTLPEVGVQQARLITISIYFWAGILKLNRAFFQHSFPWVIGPLQKNLPPILRRPLHWLGYLAPVLEVLLALGLLWPTTRTPALLGLALMHLFILACFSRWGHSVHRVIWPWNLVMYGQALLLFAGTAQVSPSQILWPVHPLTALTLLLFGLLPLAGPFTRMDPNFCHAHMSGRQFLAYLLLSRRLLARLPARLRKHCNPPALGQSHYTLDLTTWYLEEVKVVPPQQMRLLIHIAQDFLRFQAQPSDLQLLVLQIPAPFSADYPQLLIPGTRLCSGHSSRRKGLRLSQGPSTPDAKSP